MGAESAVCGRRQIWPALRDYRNNLIEKYRKAGGPERVQDVAGWLRANRALLDRASGVGVSEGPAIVTVVTEMEADKGCVEDLGALNRWPARSGVPLEDYLRLWRASCAEIGTAGRLPARLQTSLTCAERATPNPKEPRLAAI